MVTHFQSHLFSFTISFFLSLSLSFNAQIKSQKIDPMPKIGLLDRSRERSADPNIKYYMAGLFLDWLKSYFQRKQIFSKIIRLIVLLKLILCSNTKSVWIRQIIRRESFMILCTAIPYRASTGPVQGFPCEVFHTGKNLFSLQGTPVLIAGTPVFITGISLRENFTGKTLFLLQGMGLQCCSSKGTIHN